MNATLVAMTRLTTGLTAAALVAACAASPTGTPSARMPQQTTPSPSAKLRAVPAEECARFNADHVRLYAAPLIARQGAELTMGANELTGPGAAEAVPHACFTNWSATPAGAVEWSSEHIRLRIKADAPVGAELKISADLPTGSVTHTMKIVGKDEIVLTGFWRQEDIACANGAKPNEPVRELSFDDRGGYSLTFTPFESYKDYWGKALFDAKAGTLSFTIEGGNFKPTNAILGGSARIDTNGKLILDGFFFGDSFPRFAGENRKPVDGPCRYVFART